MEYQQALKSKTPNTFGGIGSFIVFDFERTHH